VLQFPLAYILSKHTDLGIGGLWWAFPVTNVLMALITFGWYQKGDWKKKRLTHEERLAEQVAEEIIIEEGAH
jgi:Na+-driven multidrug efflux pump